MTRQRLKDIELQRWLSEIDNHTRKDAKQSNKMRTYRLFKTTCLDTRQPGTVFKKLDARQSEILTNFLEIARLIPLRT